MLAMVVADITNPVYFGLIRGAERTAMHAGYTLLLAETQESEVVERAVLERIRPSVDGVILTSSRMSDAGIRTVAKTAPLVVLNRLVDQVPSVASDNVRAVKRAVEHLAAAGHRRVGYALPDDPRLSVFATPRLNGVRAACQRLGLAPPRDQQVPLDPRGAAAAVAGFLSVDDPVTAICAYNDEVALAVLAGLRAHGLTAPTDVAVIGVDNIPAAVLATPPLTTIDFHPAAIGRHLAAIVLGETAIAPDALPSPAVVVRESG